MTASFPVINWIVIVAIILLMSPYPPLAHEWWRELIVASGAYFIARWEPI